MDDVAKRREARRRKILENSQSRLTRISGVEQKTTHFVCESHEEKTESPSSEEVREIRDVQPERVLTQPPKQYRKTVVSALAVFINVLLLVVDKFFGAHSTHLNTIFLPLLVFEGIEFLSNQKTETRSFISALLIASAKNSYISSVITYLEAISTVLQDLMVYFFVFVCCDLVQYVLQVR